ncbi:MAG: dickkopf-related protein [Archangium sp.]
MCDCFTDSDCGNTTFFVCDTRLSRCVPSCTTNADCNQRPDGYALAQCSGALGCVCDLGTCSTRQCSSDSECGPNVCRDGACVAPPQVSEVARCQITPDFAVVGVDEELTFSVLAWKADESPIVIAGGASWSLIGDALSGDTSTHGFDAKFTGATNTQQAVPAVKASFGDTHCEAKVMVLPAAPLGRRVVSVIDERTARPLRGAKVVASRDDGTVILQNTSSFIETDAQGMAVLLVPQGTALPTVSVFHPDYSYQTIVRIPEVAPLLRVALQRNPTALYGGYQATFDGLPLTSNVQLARAGMSSASDLTSLRLTDEGEPTELITARIGSALEFNDTPIPLGTLTGLAGQLIKPSVAVAGVNGVCFDANGQADESDIAAGRCGVQTAWALTADVPLGDLPGDLLFANNFNFLPVIERLPLKTLSSSVQRDVQFALSTPPTDQFGLPDLSNVSAFTHITYEFKQVPLGFSFVVRTPRLPKYRDEYLDRVLASGVAMQPGRGAVPLGVGTALNMMPEDDQLDVQGDLPPGHFAVRMAPRHHGLEGASYALMTQVRSTKFPAVGRATSTLISRVPEDKLFFDPKAEDQTLDQSVRSFLSLPENGQLTATTRHFALEPRTDATLVRVTFIDAENCKWDVLVDPTMPEFSLPTPPTRDRLFADGMALSRPSRITVQTQRFDEPVTSDRLVQFAEWNARPALHDAMRFLTAWSSVELKSPNVKFLDPSLPGKTLSVGATLSIGIEGVHLGTRANDHQLDVRLTGGSAACQGAVITEELTPGLVQVTLPQACRGSNLLIEAELIDQQKAPFVPAVVARTIVSIE